MLGIFKSIFGKNSEDEAGEAAGKSRLKNMRGRRSQHETGNPSEADEASDSLRNLVQSQVHEGLSPFTVWTGVEGKAHSVGISTRAMVTPYKGESFGFSENPLDDDIDQMNIDNFAESESKKKHLAHSQDVISSLIDRHPQIEHVESPPTDTQSGEYSRANDTRFVSDWNAGESLFSGTGLYCDYEEGPATSQDAGEKPKCFGPPVDLNKLEKPQAKPVSATHEQQTLEHQTVEEDEDEYDFVDEVLFHYENSESLFDTPGVDPFEIEQPQPEMTAQPEPEPKSKLQAPQQTEAQAQTKQQTKTEPKEQTKPEPTVQVKPEVKAGVKPETKPEVKSVVKAEIKQEVKAETKAQADAKAKSETKAPEAKAKPEPKAQVESKTQTEPKAAKTAQSTKGTQSGSSIPKLPAQQSSTNQSSSKLPATKASQSANRLQAARPARIEEGATTDGKKNLQLSDLVDSVEIKTFSHPYDKFSESSLKLIAQNPKTPPGALAWLAAHRNPHIRAAVAKNPGTPIETFWVLARDHESSIRYSISENPNMSPEILRELSRDRNPLIATTAQGVLHSIRESVMNALPPSSLYSKKASASQQKLEAITASEQPEQQAEQELQGDEEFLLMIAGKPTTPGRRLKELSNHANGKIREAVAENGNTPAEILWLLARDSDPNVKIKLTRNCNLPEEILDILKDDKDSYVADAAKKVQSKLAGLRFAAEKGGNDVRIVLTWP